MPPHLATCRKDAVIRRHTQHRALQRSEGRQDGADDRYCDNSEALGSNNHQFHKTSKVSVTDYATVHNAAFGVGAPTKPGAGRSPAGVSSHVGAASTAAVYTEPEQLDRMPVYVEDGSIQGAVCPGDVLLDPACCLPSWRRGGRSPAGLPMTRPES